MSKDKRTRVGLPANGVYVPSGLENNVVEIGPSDSLIWPERDVYLDGVRIGVVYPGMTSGGRAVHKGSNVVTRNIKQKVWRARGEVPLGFGVSRYWMTRKAAVWALVVQYVVHKANEAADAPQ